MKLNMYAIKDSCSNTYQRPFYARSDGEALRSFSDIAGDSSHPIGQHPEHYSIWRLGTFSDSDAACHIETKECLAHAHDLLSDSHVTPISPGLTQ